MQQPAATAGDEQAYPATRYAWLVVGILVATAVLSYTDRQVLSLLVDPMRGELGISDTQFSLLIGTAFAVVYGIAGIPLGYLADRTSRRNMIFAGVVIWSLATVACGLSANFTQLFVSRVCVGLGEAALSPAAISLISDYFPPRRRGAAVGLFLSGIAIGVGASIAIGGVVLRAVQLGLLAHTKLAELSAWRAVLVLIGCPGLCWSLAILAIREPLRHIRADARIAMPQPIGDSTSSWRTPWLQISPIFLVLATASLVDNAVGAWTPSLLIRSFSMDPAQVGIDLGLLLTAGFGGGVLAGGILADRAGGAERRLAICLAASLLIVPAAIGMRSPHLGLAISAIPAYFALSGMVTAIGFSIILDMVPNRSRGLAMSISFFFNVTIGAGAGPTIVSVVGADLFGAGAPLGGPLATTVIAGYLVVIAALLATLRQRGRHA